QGCLPCARCCSGCCNRRATDGVIGAIEFKPQHRTLRLCTVRCMHAISNEVALTLSSDAAAIAVRMTSCCVALLYGCCKLAPRVKRYATALHLEIGSGPGIRTLNLAVNRSMTPRSEITVLVH